MLAARLAVGLPGHAFAAIDARGGRVATRGWNGESTIDLRTLIARVSELGIGRIIFTEIARDGTGEGFDVDALASVAHSTDCRITASGGARTMDDVRRLELLTPTNLDSCIVGTALYQGTMQLSVLDPA
jgi:phosphoribosylformimino-5-aminoimidazole carboxamide ribonucleotide (ProFAR) isomerase